MSGSIRPDDDAGERRRDLGLSALLVALLAALFVLPWLGPWQEGLGRLVLAGLLTAIFLSGAFSAGGRRFRLAVGLAVAAGLAAWIDAGVGGQRFLAFSRVLTILFLALTLYGTLERVFRPGRIDAHRMQGAIAAYLMLGLIGTFALAMLVQADPGAVRGLEAPGDPRRLDGLVYFSFVTLTTLGYGDIAPVSAAAKSLTSLLALSGQLFLAIVIARLVALQLAAGNERDDAA